MSAPPNTLRGEFEARVAGTLRRFDTTLATVAALEERCGDAPVAEVLNRVVLGRRSKDLRVLLEAALVASGLTVETAGTLGGQASLAEAEAFALALIAALGFEVGRRSGGEPPLGAAGSGGGGAGSPSAS